MDYSVGSLVRVRLYSGHIVDANITAIKSHSTGRKIHIVYGNVTAAINELDAAPAEQPSNRLRRLLINQASPGTRPTEYADSSKHRQIVEQVWIDETFTCGAREIFRCQTGPAPRA